MEPHGLHPPRENFLLLLEHRGSLLVHQDGAFELAEIRSARGGQLDLTNDEFALVVELVAFGRDVRVIAGEVEIEVDGVGSLIHDIACRKCDVEAVVPAAGRAQVDGHGARLVVEGHGMRADHARPHQQQRAGLMCILRRQ